MSTGFDCVCLENYQRTLNAPVCVLCDRLSSSWCRNSVECAMKKNACRSEFRLLTDGECILCDHTAFCVGSEEFKCGKNSATLNRGSYQASDCICTQGLFQGTNGCEQCPSQFFCRDNVILQCPVHMQTTQSGARDESDCSCIPGYFVYTDGGQCEKVTHGSYWSLDTVTQRGTVRECPVNTTTFQSQSIGETSCRCAPGFKNIINGGNTCVECVGQNEACFVILLWSCVTLTVSWLTLQNMTTVCSPVDMSTPCPKHVSMLYSAKYVLPDITALQLRFLGFQSVLPRWRLWLVQLVWFSAFVRIRNNSNTITKN